MGTFDPEAPHVSFLLSHCILETFAEDVTSLETCIDCGACCIGSGFHIELQNGTLTPGKPDLVPEGKNNNKSQVFYFIKSREDKKINVRPFNI